MVRSPIADSWRRSRDLGISPHQHSRPIEKGFERLLRSQIRQLLARAGERVVSRLEEQLEDAPFTLTLADADGLVLVQRGDPAMLKRGERMGIVPGSRWSELDAGTNGMGTALFMGQTSQVFAAEHYCEGFHSLICTASPVRHPLTGQILGVFDVSADFGQESTRVWSLTSQTAGSIEAEIRRLLMSADQMLLKALSMAGDGIAAYAVDLEGQRTIGNRGATAVIGPEDHAALWGFIKTALIARQVEPMAYELQSGRGVIVHINPVTVGDETVGALIVLRDSPRTKRAQPAEERSANPDWSPFSATADWLRTAQAAAASEGPVLVIGEAGSGKSAIAAALHRNRENAGRLTVIDCASLDGTSLESEWDRAFSQGPQGSVLLERLEELEPFLQARVAQAVDRAAADDGPRVFATATTASEDGLREAGIRSELLDRIAVHLVCVPPLRERTREFDRIVREVLVVVGQGRLPIGPPITAEALSVLRSYHWPGNVRQLQNVLRRALAQRPRTQVDVKSLHPDIVAGAALPHLTRIEQLEVEAILNALRTTGGNVSRAAGHLGLSRATVYRRLHSYQMRGGKRSGGPGSEGRRRA